VRRHRLVGEIMKRAKKIKANQATIVFLLATMNDKVLTKFHKDFTEKKEL